MLSHLLATVGVLLSLGGPAHAQDSCTQITVQTVPNVDMKEVRQAWLGWYNDYRSKMGLAPYSLDDTLDLTAGNWSYYSVKRGTINHQREWKGAYYDYKLIGQWFANFGVTFPNVHGVTYSENIGWNYYNCKKTDCTDDLIAATKSTFDFFLGEKGKAYHAHYDSIVNSEFTKMGVGVAVDQTAKKYYVTVHFGTDVHTEKPLCAAQ